MIAKEPLFRKILSWFVSSYYALIVLLFCILWWWDVEFLTFVVYLSHLIQEKSGKPYLEESEFEELEKEFQDVINLLKGDKTLEKFRIEYEKLHAVMKKSHENEKRLMEKCRELNAELVVNSSKVAALTKLTKDDQETISSMKTVKFWIELNMIWNC